MKYLIAVLSITAIVCLALCSRAHAGTAFFQYEIQTGGITKQCVYDYLGSTYTLTVSNVSICPLNIQVP